MLEGGGALGLAHIGVIQWLEEHHIPVRYVAGTSMGALVGGIYATGHSPEDLRKIISGIQWTEVIRGATPYRDLSFRRKEDAQDYPNSLEFGLKHGIQFPEGFNSGQQVGLILDQIALPYSEVKDFNNFPISFGCVATDLVSGKQEIFRSGSLALALRSTMSLPGIFTPVREGDHIFADGALLDNLPVDVAQDMGADLTVAVHLQTKAIDPKDPLSTFSVLGRSLSVVIAANELRSMEQADILISVPLEDFSSFDYARADEMIKVGYAAAESKAAVLSAFRLNDDDWKDYMVAAGFAETHAIAGATIYRSPGGDARHCGADPEESGGGDRAAAGCADAGHAVECSDRPGKVQQPGLSNGGEERATGTGHYRGGKELRAAGGAAADFAGWFGLRQSAVQRGGADYVFRLGAFGRELRNDFILGSEYGIRSEYFVPFKTGQPVVYCAAGVCGQCAI